MKILIMTDMEGVAGVLDHDEWVTKSGLFYLKGMRLLTEEVNAAVRGLYAEGATEIIVVDGHGQGGIDPELLDERVKLMRGAPSPPEPWGLAATPLDETIRPMSPEAAERAFLDRYEELGGPRTAQEADHGHRA